MNLDPRLHAVDGEDHQPETSTAEPAAEHERQHTYNGNNKSSHATHVANSYDYLRRQHTYAFFVSAHVLCERSPTEFICPKEAEVSRNLPDDSGGQSLVQSQRTFFFQHRFNYTPHRAGLKNKQNCETSTQFGTVDDLALFSSPFCSSCDLASRFHLVHGLQTTFDQLGGAYSRGRKDGG